MRITSYGHSCLLVEAADARLLIDPGTFSSGFESVRGLTAILVTHQHADHLDRSRLPDQLAANPDARLYCDPQTAAELVEGGIDATAVTAGDELAGVGVDVSVHGDVHAVVHRDIPIVNNVSYLIDRRLFHPGDAFCVPAEPVEILAVPAAAPWMALKEAIDYERAVAAKHAFPIHTAVVSQEGLTIHLRLLESMGPADSTFNVPTVGVPFDL